MLETIFVMCVEGSSVIILLKYMYVHIDSSINVFVIIVHFDIVLSLQN